VAWLLFYVCVLVRTRRLGLDTDDEPLFAGKRVFESAARHHTDEPGVLPSLGMKFDLVTDTRFVSPLGRRRNGEQKDGRPPIGNFHPRYSDRLPKSERPFASRVQSPKRRLVVFHPELRHSSFSVAAFFVSAAGGDPQQRPRFKETNGRAIDHW